MNKKASILSKFLALYFSFFMVFWCGPVLALPQNGSVIAGAANIGNSSANFLEINQQTQRAIIDWSSFSIANGETTVFNQPGISAATLNRVTGGNLSEIFGHLKANGSLYLINPNGILIGSTGVIDVNTFIASTLNINNNAFMSGGDMIFSGNSNASIQNFGTINAMEGDVFLISRKIENAGTINAPQGAVGLAAGEPADGENLEVLLKASGGQRIFIRTKKEKKVATETTTDETVTTTKEVDDSTLTLTETEKNATEVPDATDTQITDLNTEKTNTESAEIETTQNVVNIKDFAAGAEPEFTYEYEYVWEPVTLNLNVGEIETDSNATDTTTEALTTENTSSDLSEDSTTISAEDASIINTGIINAVQAELKTYGGNEYALAINNEGEIRATGVENRNGVVYLTAENGDVNNSGLISSQNSNGDGGRVSLQAVNGSTTSSGIIDVSSTTDTGVGGYAEVLGNKVEITGNTLVNASGNAGGGEILIGGDYQGKNENIQNASETLISALAQVQANAINSGDGGKVIAWANEKASVFGSISARGGMESGNGGFIETSAKHLVLDPTTIPDASAPNGEAGTWLIDPNNISIVSGSGSTNATQTASTFNTSDDTSIIGIDLIKTALTSTNVTITTGTFGSNSEAGDIYWTSGADLDFDGIGANKTLTLQAHNDIIFDANIFDSEGTTDSLNVNFYADFQDNNGVGGIVINGTIATQGGNINFNTNANSAQNIVVNSGASLNSGGGNINMFANVAQLNPDNGIGTLIDGATIDTEGGDFWIKSYGGMTGDSNIGIKIQNSTINTNNPDPQVYYDGYLDFKGYGKGDGSYNHGIFIDNTTINTANNMIYMQGNAGGADSNNSGITITNSTLSAENEIGLYGTGSQNATGTSNYGIDIYNSILEVTSIVDGNIIYLSGTGGTGISDNDGLIVDFSEVSSMGSQGLQMYGVAGEGLASHAIELEDSILYSYDYLEIGGDSEFMGESSTGIYGNNISVTSENGSLNIWGYGGYYGDYNHGLFITNSLFSSLYDTYLYGDGGGSFDASFNYGIYFENVIVSADDGLFIEGDGGSELNEVPGLGINNYGVYTLNSQFYQTFQDSSQDLAVNGNGGYGDFGNVGVFLENSVFENYSIYSDLSISGSSYEGTNSHGIVLNNVNLYGANRNYILGDAFQAGDDSYGVLINSSLIDGEFTEIYGTGGATGTGLVMNDTGIFALTQTVTLDGVSLDPNLEDGTFFNNVILDVLDLDPTLVTITDNQIDMDPETTPGIYFGAIPFEEFFETGFTEDLFFEEFLETGFFEDPFLGADFFNFGGESLFFLDLTSDQLIGSFDSGFGEFGGDTFGPESDLGTNAEPLNETAANTENETATSNENENNDSQNNVEETAPTSQSAGPVNGTDTSFDDHVLAPGDTMTFGGPDAGAPPPTLNTATAPEVRSGLGNTNSLSENVPPPVDNVPPPPPVPPAPPELDVTRVLPGQMQGMNFGGGQPLIPSPATQIKLNFSTGPAVQSSLQAVLGN